jgi:type I restriction enzyme, S subunit
MSITTLKLKQIATHLSRGDTPDYVESSEIQVINQACVWPSGLDTSKAKYQNPKNVDKITAWIKRDDILVNSTGTGTLGRVSLVREELEKPAFADGHVTILRDNYQRFHPRFLFYCLSIQQGHLTALCSVGATNQIELSRSKFGDLELSFLPLRQQNRIADYLDCETQKIDALIAAKKRLLELLAEKKRSLIAHAVTRGLNADAPMKDSGIEWLEKIPEHWEVTKVRWFVRSLEQGWSPQADEREPAEDEWGVLKLNAVKDGKFDPAKAKALPKELEVQKELEIQIGDFLVTRANTPDLVGDVCYVEQTRSYLMLSDLIYRLRLREEELDGKFLSYFLQSPVGKIQIKIDARGSSSSMVKISQGHILDWFLPLPPITEQQEIIAELQMRVQQIDLLSNIAEKTIALLHERRTSLISAAVTGQYPIPD